MVFGTIFLCPDEKGTLCDSATVPAAVISAMPGTISATVPETKGMGRRYQEE